MSTGWGQIWLAVLDEAPEEEEIRRSWNSKENSVLDRVHDGDRIWVGEYTFDECALEVDDSTLGAAIRVSHTMFYMGTINGYQAPMITDELIDRLIRAFDAGHGGLPTVSRPKLVEFLRARRVDHIVTDSEDQEPG